MFIPRRLHFYTTCISRVSERIHYIIMLFTPSSELHHCGARDGTLKGQVESKQEGAGSVSDLEATGVSQRSLGSGFWCGLFNLLAAQ